MAKDKDNLKTDLGAEDRLASVPMKQQENKKVAETKDAVSVTPVIAPVQSDNYHGHGGCYIVGDDGIKRRVTD